MKKRCVLFVTGIKNIPFSLQGVMLAKSQCWSPQTTYIVQLPFSASGFCWFWEEKGEAHQNFAWGVTPWKALSAFHRFFNGHVEKMNCPVWDLDPVVREGIVRKEHLAQQFGHWDSCAAVQDAPAQLRVPVLHLAQLLPSRSNGQQFTAVDVLPSLHFPWECVYRG